MKKLKIDGDGCGDCYNYGHGDDGYSDGDGSGYGDDYGNKHGDGCGDGHDRIEDFSYGNPSEG